MSKLRNPAIGTEAISKPFYPLTQIQRAHIKSEILRLETQLRSHTIIRHREIRELNLMLLRYKRQLRLDDRFKLNFVKARQLVRDKRELPTTEDVLTGTPDRNPAREKVKSPQLIPQPA